MRAKYINLAISKQIFLTKRKDGNLKTFWSLLPVAFIFLCVSHLHAEGTYYVDRDKEGVYLQTDEHGGWYIDKADLKRFRIGETGTYQTGSDRYGIYIVTDQRRKFYIDLDASAKLDMEVEAFNGA
jgi:hypothetical protein